MIYAQIKNLRIVNIIAADENTDLALFLEGFDLLIRIDILPVIPGISWTYDGLIFSPPVESVDDPCEDC